MEEKLNIECDYRSECDRLKSECYYLKKVNEENNIKHEEMLNSLNKKNKNLENELQFYKNIIKSILHIKD